MIPQMFDNILQDQNESIDSKKTITHHLTHQNEVFLFQIVLLIENQIFIHKYYY